MPIGWFKRKVREVSNRLPGPRAKVEKILLVHYGKTPDFDESRRLLREVGIRADFDPTDIPAAAVEAKGGHRATVVHAYAAVLTLQDKGQLRPNALQRTSAHVIDEGGEQLIVAVVWNDIIATETNAWVRQLIPVHLDRAERDDVQLAQERSWRMLEDESTVSFVAAAQDGEGKQFDDVYIAVSHLPETDPQRMLEHMPKGFQEWSTTILTNLEAPLDKSDIAHWLLCTDDKGTQAVHLTYLAPGKHAVYPSDLLEFPESEEEYSDAPDADQDPDLVERLSDTPTPPTD
ncbi:hypothetical protein OHB26_19960 [Nocardia sp. NBC_01503]|uniref:hypothetical protein n=1 Tax=Nocardia sp. NBC_01503 TaxID=2975997 RepID=UPI002E7C15AC|nr:hypothetical protein [Nocardia sp. NBC_01503]WTL29291.1 hypothetical protein OHB26_19960 [Nocardia sp. NBC_01503]